MIGDNPCTRPPRIAKPTSTQLRIYHNFLADSVKITSHHPDSIYVGDSVRVEGWNRPFLVPQARLKYDWNVSGPAGGHFRFDNQIWRHNFFSATKPGTYRVLYTVVDSVTGYSRSSPQKTVEVRPPEIQIMMPVDSAKFTFSAGNPGILACTAYAVTHPAYFADSLQWSITPIAGSHLTTIPNPPRGDSVWFRFENLPSDNDEFGRKYITASLVNYNVRDSVMVKAYYPKIALNHPGPYSPNWYYYWDSTSASSGTHVFGGPRCSQMPDPGYYEDGEPYFRICNSCKDDWPVQCYDNALFDGIDNYAETCLHEGQHMTDYFAWWHPAGYDTTYDHDRDWVPDTVEASYGYNPFLWDTDGDLFEDSEDHALDRECEWQQCSADAEDWANPGHQY